MHLGVFVNKKSRLLWILIVLSSMFLKYKRNKINAIFYGICGMHLSVLNTPEHAALLLVSENKSPELYGYKLELCK